MKDILLKNGSGNIEYEISGVGHCENNLGYFYYNNVLYMICPKYYGFSDFTTLKKVSEDKDFADYIRLGFKNNVIKDVVIKHFIKKEKEKLAQLKDEYSRLSAALSENGYYFESCNDVEKECCLVESNIQSGGELELDPSVPDRYEQYIYRPQIIKFDIDKQKYIIKCSMEKWMNKRYLNLDIKDDSAQ